MKVEVAVEDVSEAKKNLSIEVPVEEISVELDKAYAAYSRYAKVPGFRPGRVPRNVIQQRFGKEVREEVLERLVSHSLSHAIFDNKLRVVGEPQIADLSFSDGQPLKYKAAVEVIPEFELKQYKGLKLTRRVQRVSEERIDEILERSREESAEFVPVEDRPSREGDFVSINLTGKYVEPPQDEDLKVDDVEIELGSEGVQPEFTGNLTGVKAGDVREFRVVYPEDFGSPGLAGKTIDFTATVAAVRQKELPELDDEFAKETGEFETLEQMRQKVREDLEHSVRQLADNRLRDDLLSQILEAHEFEIPPTLIEQQAADRTREYAYLLVQSGLSRQSLKDIDWEARMDKAREQAVRDVRAALVVGRIGEAEQIDISDQEIDTEIARIAGRTGEAPAQIKERLTKDDALSSIENRLRYQKVIEMLVDSAEVTTEEVTGDETGEAAETENIPPPAEEGQPAEQS